MPRTGFSKAEATEFALMVTALNSFEDLVMFKARRRRKAVQNALEKAHHTVMEVRHESPTD